MIISADFGLIIATVLLMMRLGALFVLTPLFSVAQVPVRIRVLFLLGISLLLVLAMPVSAYPEWSITQFLQAAISELVLGALLAFGLFAAFGAFMLGGRILDFQMGFSVAGLIDPATNTQNPLLGTVLSLFAVTVFFLLDGHHMLLRGIAYSLEVAPLGGGLLDISPAPIVAQFGLMFSYGLMLVAPAVFAILLLDVGMGVAARTMPQMNMFIVSLPIKILLGLVMLALSLRYIGPLMQRIYASIFYYWQSVLLG